MKRLLTFLLAGAMLFSLSACGGGAGNDPLLGSYNAVEVLSEEYDMTIEEYCEDEPLSLELLKDGKGKLHSGEEVYEFTWKQDGSNILWDIGIGEEFTASIKDGAIILDPFDIDIPLLFVKEGSEAPDLSEDSEQEETPDTNEAKKPSNTEDTSEGFQDGMPHRTREDALTSAKPKPQAEHKPQERPGIGKADRTQSEAEPAVEPVSVQEYWDGDWYGTWQIIGGDGAYADVSDARWDAFARFKMENDEAGELHFWDDAHSSMYLVALMNVRIEQGKGPMGRLACAGGQFLDMMVEDGYWTADPAAGTFSVYKDTINISALYEDSEGSFYYDIILRPWGTLWDDFEEGDPQLMPDGYHDWYVPLIESGQPMPDEVE